MGDALMSQSKSLHHNNALCFEEHSLFLNPVHHLHSHQGGSIFLKTMRATKIGSCVFCTSPPLSCHKHLNHNENTTKLKLYTGQLIYNKHVFQKDERYQYHINKYLKDMILYQFPKGREYQQL